MDFKKAITVKDLQSVNLEEIERLFWETYSDCEDFELDRSGNDLLDTLNLIKMHFGDIKEVHQYLYLFHLNIVVYNLIDELIDSGVITTIDDVKRRLSPIEGMGEID